MICSSLLSSIPCPLSNLATLVETLGGDSGQATFADPVHGYALDVSGQNNTNGIVRTADGGATWLRVDLIVKL
jgi:hypothetical protein